MACSFSQYLPGFDFKLFDSTPVSQLSKAVERQDIKSIEQILSDTTIKVDYQEPKFGHTLLMLAVANGKYESVKCLLEHGASPNLRVTSDINDNCMIIGAKYGSCPDTLIYDLLLQYGGDINTIQRIDKTNSPNPSLVISTPLIEAIGSWCDEMVYYLLRHGANPNLYTQHEGYGAISEALILDQLDIASYLIHYKGIVIPKYILIRPALGNRQEQKLSITDLLNENHYEEGTENYRLKNEIIQYLASKGLR